MNNDIIEKLYDVLDYLKTDDYDDTCEGHIEMLKKLEYCIREIEKESEEK